MSKKKSTKKKTNSKPKSKKSVPRNKTVGEPQKVMSISDYIAKYATVSSSKNTIWSKIKGFFSREK